MAFGDPDTPTDEGRTDAPAKAAGKTHHVHILEMNGESCRLGQSRADKDAPIN